MAYKQFHTQKNSMKDIVQFFITKVFLFGIVLFSFVSATGHATLTDEEIQEKLTQKYEQNADELMALIKQEQFGEVEAFINYVVKHDHVTRDGIRYFKALVEHWFFASEVLEFRRTKPVPQDVLPYLDRWVEHNPQSAIAHIIRGVYHIERAWEIRSRKWAKDVKKENWKSFHELHLLAKRDLEKAYELDPSNPHSSRQLIRVQRALNARDTEATEKYFQQAIQNHPTFYWAYRAKLENMMPKWGGTWEAMFVFASETAQNAPPTTLLPLILAHAFEEAAARSQDKEQFYNQPQVWNPLESLYKQVIADFPFSSRWKVRFAQIATYAGKHDMAMQYVDLAEKTDPNDYRIYELKASLAERQEQWTVEEQSAQRLIQLCPTYEVGYRMLGYALIMQQRYEEAIEVYSQAIELNPDDYWYWEIRCYANKELGKYQQAIADCTKAIELNENTMSPYWNRGFAYEQLGNKQAAEADYQMYDDLKSQQ
jgi:tetratricopeptide (TPR) repeat protein